MYVLPIWKLDEFANATNEQRRENIVNCYTCPARVPCKGDREGGSGYYCETCGATGWNVTDAGPGGSVVVIDCSIHGFPRTTAFQARKAQCPLCSGRIVQHNRWVSQYLLTTVHSTVPIEERAETLRAAFATSTANRSDR